MKQLHNWAMLRDLLGPSHPSLSKILTWMNILPDRGRRHQPLLIFRAVPFMISRIFYMSSHTFR